MTSEREAARILANKVLERPNADPDDDLAVLARQLLRTDEAVLILRTMALDLLALVGGFVDEGAKYPQGPQFARVKEVLKKTRTTVEKQT